MNFNGTLIIADGDDFLNSLAASFKKLDPSYIRVRSCPFRDALQHCKDTLPRLAFLDIRTASTAELGVIHTIVSIVPPQNIVCVGKPSDVSLVLDLVKLGINVFFEYPVTAADLSGLSQRLSAPQAPVKTAETRTGRVVTFYSAKGGTGVTLVVSNIGAVLARRPGAHVVACDLSPQCGDISTYLNLNPKFTVRDVMDNEAGLDRSFLEGVMSRHSSGLSVLAAPRADQMPLTADNLNGLRALLTLLRANFGLVLIDAGTLNPALLNFVMSESDQLFLIGNPDVISIKGLVHFFNKLRGMHYEPGKINIVINRFNSKTQIDAKEFEKMTKHPVGFFLPNNYPLCIESVNAGEPLNERSELAHKIAEIAHAIAGDAVLKPSAHRGVLR